MTSTKTTYQLNKFKTLIDLNGDTTNFSIAFRVTPHDPRIPVDMLVITQTDLDNNENLEYKRIQGEISGDVVHDKGIYQNYYLILKAEQPCQCDVEIMKQEIPKSAMNFQQQGQQGQQGIPPPMQPDQGQQGQDQGQDANLQLSPPNQPQFPTPPANKRNWGKIILIILGISGVALILYWVSKRRKKGDNNISLSGNNNNNNSASPPTTVGIEHASPPRSPPRSPSYHSPSYSPAPKMSFIDQLKNLKL